MFVFPFGIKSADLELGEKVVKWCYEIFTEIEIVVGHDFGKYYATLASALLMKFY